MKAKLNAPYRVGQESEFGVHSPNVIYDADGEGVLTIYGVAMNCRRAELENDPKYAEPLAFGDLVCKLLNEVAETFLQFEDWTATDFGTYKVTGRLGKQPFTLTIEAFRPRVAEVANYEVVASSLPTRMPELEAQAIEWLSKSF